MATNNLEKFKNPEGSAGEIAALEKPPVPEIEEKERRLREIGPEIIEKEEHPEKEELDRAKFEMAKPSIAPVTKSQVCKDIEKVLEKDLKEVYQSMSPENRKIFRQKGEETAAKIEILLKQTKFKIRQILELIRKWLLLIPGVSKFFLEQEAKIKSDQILNIRKSLEKKGEF